MHVVLLFILEEYDLICILVQLMAFVSSIYLMSRIE